MKPGKKYQIKSTLNTFKTLRTETHVNVTLTSGFLSFNKKFCLHRFNPDIH